MTLAGAIHLLLHAAVPAAVAVIVFRKNWLRAWAWMMAGMVVDLDHLLAVPLYDPGRCSIGFHPLHQPLPILLYAVLAAIPRTRIFGIGLLIHMVLDVGDCAVQRW